MRKYIKFTVLSLLAALLLWWFGRQLNWIEVSSTLKGSDWRLIAAAVAVVSATYLVRAYRWRTLLAPLVPAGLRELFAATAVGFGAVFLVGRAGEVVRPAFLCLRDRRVRPAASFVTIGVERIFDMLAIVLFFAANLLVFRAPGADVATYERVREAGVTLLIGAAAGVVALVLLRRHAAELIKWLDRLFAGRTRLLSRVGRILTGLLENLARALGVLVNARELFITIAWTALLWAAIAAANLLVFRAFGLQIGLSETLFVLGWSLVGSLVPTPGGAAGTFHLATAAGLIFLGVTRTREEAAAVSVVLHLVVFGPALFFGLYYFLLSDVSFEHLRRLTSIEETGRDVGGGREPSAWEESAGGVESSRAARAQSGFSAEWP